MAIKVLISLLVMTNLVNGRMVTTLSGRVRGELVQDVNATYYSYRGIPYAEPPIGHLRFMVSNFECGLKFHVIDP